MRSTAATTTSEAATQIAARTYAIWKAAYPCAYDVEIDVIDASPNAPPTCITTLLKPEPRPASASGTSDIEMVSSGRKDDPAPAPSNTYAASRTGA